MAEHSSAHKLQRGCRLPSCLFVPAALAGGLVSWGVLSFLGTLRVCCPTVIETLTAPARSHHCGVTLMGGVLPGCLEKLLS